MALTYPHKLKDLKQAFQTLQISIKEAEFNVFARDSMVIRFLYTSELLWKTLKVYLREIHKKDAPYAREVFRECRNVRIFDEKEVEMALQILDDRNFCAHAYQESVVIKISKNIPSYAPLIQKAITTMEQDL